MLSSYVHATCHCWQSCGAQTQPSVQLLRRRVLSKLGRAGQAARWGPQRGPGPLPPCLVQAALLSHCHCPPLHLAGDKPCTYLYIGISAIGPDTSLSAADNHTWAGCCQAVCCHASQLVVLLKVYWAVGPWNIIAGTQCKGCFVPDC